MPEFQLPSADVLANMDKSEIENLRVEAAKAKMGVKRFVVLLKAEKRAKMRQYKAEMDELTDKIEKGELMEAEYRDAEQMLKGKYWDKKDGFA